MFEMKTLAFLFAYSFGLAKAQSVATTIIVQAPEPTNEPSYIDDSTFQKAILNSTNFYRQEHNASAVHWNDSLASYASNYTNGCKFEHSGGPHGENLAEGYANTTLAVEAWGNERTKYDFSNGGFSSETGHFTQLVWKATTSVGCGRKFCNGINQVPGWYLVCEYEPRGNVLGQFQTEVQGQVNQSQTCDLGEACSSTTSTRSTMSLMTATMTAPPGSTSTSGVSSRWLITMRLLTLKAIWAAVSVALFVSW